jgi:hypothetical protein
MRKYTFRLKSQSHLLEKNYIYQYYAPAESIWPENL